jgi:hypothetical protein
MFLRRPISSPYCRYLPTQKVLLLAANPEIEATSMLPVDIGDDPEERLEAAVRGFLTMVVDTEPQQRTMLQLSLEADTATRSRSSATYPMALGGSTRPARRYAPAQ